jgi:phenylacetate-CoA ligase
VSSLPAYDARDSAIDRLAASDLRALQTTRLRASVQYAFEHTALWRKKFDEVGVRPEEIRELRDLPRVPFCSKRELLADQAAHPPFGSYLGAEPHRLVRFTMTSGTTGTPLRRVFSARDWTIACDRLGRHAHVGPGDVVMMLGPIDGLMGPSASFESATRAGACVVLAGLYDSRTKARLIRDLRPAAVHGSPSYLLHLVDVARAVGVDLTSAGIRTVVSSGEPGAAVAATRQRLTDGWGAFVRDGYGLTELFPLGGGCRHSTALHIASDLVITEIVDAESGESLPCGQPGEVVYTNIAGDTQPLLRYRTGDVARLAAEGACACGFTGSRLERAIEGRVDDMIWLRGMNVFPSAIEAVVREFAELADEYEIEVRESATLPALTVRAERRPGADPALEEGLANRVREAVMSAVRVSVNVELLAHGTLPRADPRAKKRRVRRVN